MHFLVRQGLLLVHLGRCSAGARLAGEPGAPQHQLRPAESAYGWGGASGNLGKSKFRAQSQRQGAAGGAIVDEAPAFGQHPQALLHGAHTHHSLPGFLRPFLHSQWKLCGGSASPLLFPTGSVPDSAVSECVCTPSLLRCSSALSWAKPRSSC